MQRLHYIVATIVLAVAWGAPAAAQQKVFKVATVAPEGSAWMNAMREGGKEIEARTDGRVKFKFYGGGVMGNDKKVLRKMRVGQLHGGTFVSSGLAERYGDIQLYGLPLLFESQAEVDYVRERLDEVLIREMQEQSGLVVLGIARGGFAQIMAGAPVRRADDLRGRKVWVPEGDLISYAAMEELGLSPVTLPITDVLTGLQTGLIDIIGSSPVGALVLQWHTKVKYVTDLPVSYLFGLLALEERALRRVSDEDQAVIRDVLGKVYDGFEVENLEDDRKALAALIDSGIDVIAPDPELAPVWKRDAAALRNRLAEEGLYSIDKLRRIDALLTEYRSSNASADAAAP